MKYVGDYEIGKTFHHRFMTVNASGVPTTLGNSPSLQYYVDGGTTGFTSGLTLSTDFNSTTGLNSVQVIATTSCTGIASGVNVSVVLAAGTVSGVSLVGYPIIEWSCYNRSPLRPETVGRTLAVSATGGAAVDWANVKSPGATVDLSATTLFTTTNATNVTNNVGAIVTASNTVVNANVTSISTVVNANVTAISTNVGAVVTACNTVVALTSAYDFAKGTAAMTEAYAANGVAPTPVQALYAIQQMLMQFAISGTSITVKKLDNATTAFTVTLDDATNPTSAERV